MGPIIKRLILSALNSFFGMNLTLDELDIILAALGLLFKKAFPSKKDAIRYLARFNFYGEAMSGRQMKALCDHQIQTMEQVAGLSDEDTELVLKKVIEHTIKVVKGK